MFREKLNIYIVQSFFTDINKKLGDINSSTNVVVLDKRGMLDTVRRHSLLRADVGHADLHCNLSLLPIWRRVCSSVNVLLLFFVDKDFAVNSN